MIFFGKMVWFFKSFISLSVIFSETLSSGWDAKTIILRHVPQSRLTMGKELLITTYIKSFSQRIIYDFSLISPRIKYVVMYYRPSQIIHTEYYKQVANFSSEYIFSSFPIISLWPDPQK